MNKKESALQFPCSFPLKVMGINTEEFPSAVTAILGKHLGSQKITYVRRLSSGNKYQSITATFTAESKKQLDAIYQDLNRHKLVVMTL